ncbi:hypothetical protein Bca101_014278 [Brassica carinata]
MFLLRRWRRSESGTSAKESAPKPFLLPPPLASESPSPLPLSPPLLLLRSIKPNEDPLYASSAAVKSPLTPKSYGGYSVSLSFGTPSQTIPFVFDTGSSLVWFPCTSRYLCSGCNFPGLEPTRITRFVPRNLGFFIESDDILVAVGYADESIRIWHSEKGTCEATLNGHKGAVTALRYNKSGSMFASGSKDNDVILWDVVGQVLESLGSETQHCMQIISGHHSEVWSVDVDPEEKYLVTGSADPELRFYAVKQNTSLGSLVSDSNANGDHLTESKWGVLLPFGEIERQTKEKQLKYSKRRLRRKEKKSSKDEVETEKADTVTVPTVPDVFKLLQVIRAGRKISSFSFCPITPRDSLATLALSVNNNSLEFYTLKSSENEKTATIEHQGHRSDVRSVALSDDNALLMSTSHSEVKIWNPSTGSCLGTIDSGYGVCSLIVPKSKYGIVGTKSGVLEIIDIGSDTKVEEVEAHGGTIWPIARIPDDTGFVTDAKQLTVSKVRSMKMNDDVLAVAISPDAKHIAVALLDSTVKVFYVDSLKFFLSLYGHKLPVMCIDISSDGELIITGSQDKNIKIWGLDFGDCHKSIFAHDDSVMGVKFVRNTHYLFGVGKDRLVKYWDADKFELLLTLGGHHAEIWCFAVSNRGDFLVTGSHDRSMRRWDRTEEPFFLEGEKEKRLEELFESEIDNSGENRHGGSQEEITEEGVAGLAKKTTVDVLSAADSIIEALEVADNEKNRVAEYEEEKLRGKVPDLAPNIVMLGLSPSEFVLKTISKEKTNDLEHILLPLPFSDALKLLSYIESWTLIPDKLVTWDCLCVSMCIEIIHAAARPILSVLKDILHAKVKQMMASRSDAPFRDAKAKLMEIRPQQAKRMEALVSEAKRAPSFALTPVFREYINSIDIDVET